MTLDFWRICTVSGLLHLALFLLMPVVPFASLYLIYILGMLVVSPFHAWLADAYRRKYVLMLPLLFLTGLPFGFLYASEYWQWLLLMFVAGMCYGLALSVGNTISIDIVESERRSKANVAYTYATFFGAFLGLCVVHPLLRYAGLEVVYYVSSAFMLLALLITSRIYVAFRAPMGFAYCSIDRFFLLRTWLLALNMLLVGLVLGLLLPLALSSQAYLAILAMLLILLPLKSVVSSFVNLSEHCQRATAVHSCLFFTIVGILLGAGISSIYRCVSCSETMSLLALLASLLCLPFSVNYYRRHKIRE